MKVYTAMNSKALKQPMTVEGATRTHAAKANGGRIKRWGLTVHAQAKNASSASSKSGGGKASQSPMTSDAAARIQSAEAKANDGKVEKGSFASRAQSAAANNELPPSKGSK